jgi:hypothetical protein
MWWLSFHGGGVVIVEAASLVHARLLAVVNGLFRAISWWRIDAGSCARNETHRHG